MEKFPLAALPLILMAEAGCRADAPTIIENTVYLPNESTCPVDGNTGPMQYSWLSAESELATCLADSEAEFRACLEDEDTEVDCFDENNSNNDWCYYWEAKKVNKLPLRECGVAVFDLNGTPNDEGYLRDSNDADEDEDGVSTWFEYLMGSNPCAQVSFYSAECLTDGEMDYDADGISNADDENPYCHGENGAGDPGDYPSDCV